MKEEIEKRLNSKIEEILKKDELNYDDFKILSDKLNSIRQEETTKEMKEKMAKMYQTI